MDYIKNIMENFKDSVPTQVDFTAELQALRRFQKGEQISPEMGIEDLLNKIVTKATPRLEIIKGLYDRYNLINVPILHERPVCDPMEIDNRLNNDFFKEIVDEKAGYFAGNPMTFSFPDESTRAAERFDDFKVRNRLDDTNYETTKNCAIAGYDARLVYIKREVIGYDALREPIYQAVEAIKQIPAYETILLGESGYDEPEYAVRCFSYDNIDGEETTRVELYMPFKAHIFEGSGLDDLSPVDLSNELVGGIDTGRELGIIDYPFSKCPLYGYENNAELRGDAESVLSLIDAYDRVSSDTDSELEAFRSAYLAFFGVTAPNDEDGDVFDAKSTGALYFSNPNGVQQNAKFITKDMPYQAKEAHLERIEDNIYRFSQTPNLTEKKTGTAVSGEALKQRMMPMENKTGTFERKFVSGNIRMLELLADVYRITGDDFNPYDVTQTFKRKMPENLLYEAEVFEVYKNILPIDQAYSMFSFSDNPRELGEWYKENQMTSPEDMYEMGDVDEQRDEGLVDEDTENVNEQSEPIDEGTEEATFRSKLLRYLGIGKDKQQLKDKK